MNNVQIKNSGIWAIFWVLVVILWQLGTLTTHLKGIEQAIDRNGTAIDKISGSTGGDIVLSVSQYDCHLGGNGLVWFCDLKK